MEKDIFICRTCLKPNLSKSCKRISDQEEDSRILEMLSYSIPEMDMFLVTNPVICNKCLYKLQIAFEFKTECLKNEEKLLKYTDKFGIKCVDFSDYVDHMGSNKVKRENNNYTGINQSKVEEDFKKPLPPVISHFECKKCVGCTMKEIRPDQHLKVNIGPFLCANCDKQYAHINDLRKHMLKHTKQRRCKICDKSFRDLHMLRKHLWSHTGAKPFACHLCPKRFQQKHCLKQHVQRHQGSEAIKCKFCHKLFSTTYNAKVHMRTVHRDREYCDLCGETFNSKRELVQHLQTESKTCGKNVKQEGNNKLLQIESSVAEETVVKDEPDCVPIHTMLIKEEPFIQEESDPDHEDVFVEDSMKSVYIKNEEDVEVDVEN